MRKKKVFGRVRHRRCRRASRATWGTCSRPRRPYGAHGGGAEAEGEGREQEKAEKLKRKRRSVSRSVCACRSLRCESPIWSLNVM